MTLLELERVGKSYHRGSRVALDDVTLVVEAGEMVVVWGERKSGRSTLLRIAAGMEAPDTGVVRFAGRNLAERGEEQLGSAIGYCRREFRPLRGQTVIDQLVAGQRARKIPRSVARTHAWKTLERVGAQQCAPLAASELKVEETVRVAVARALTSDPRLIIIDEPIVGVDPLQRDSILKLLRSLADDGLAILATTGEGLGFMGADRVLSLDKGRLRGDLTPDLAPVTELEHHRQARA